MTLFSIERFVAVYYPFELRRIFCTARVIILILLLSLVALIFYLFTISANEISFSKNGYYCGIRYDMMLTAIQFSKIESIVAVLIPFIIISTLNICIVFKLKKSYLIKKKQEPESDAMKLTNYGIYTLNSLSRRTIKRIIKKRISRSTRILLILSLAFVLFHFPLAIIKSM